MNSQEKYNLEYRFIQDNRVVDKVSVAPFQEPKIIKCADYPEEPNEVLIDLSAHNYFIVDLEDFSGVDSDRTIRFEISNPAKVERFEVLVIEGLGITRMDWNFHQQVVFPWEYHHGPFRAPFFDSLKDERREMLITFVRRDIDGESVYFAVPTRWFESSLLKTRVKFEIKQPSPLNPAVPIPAEGVRVRVSTQEGFQVTNEFGNVFFTLPRGYEFSYIISVGGLDVQTGTFSTTESQLLISLMI